MTDSVTNPMTSSVIGETTRELLESGTLVDALAALDSGAISSVELLEAQVARIEAFDGPINAVVAMDLVRARAEAQAADDARSEAIASGTNLSELGALRGIPMTIKDTYETEGLVTTSGAPEYADHVPDSDADMTAALRQAGAIVFGKTNVPLHAADHQSYNDVYGVTSNPRDVTRTPGGSSGGAAASVASGFTLAEVGSDIGASIRLPAHFNGVFGLKPTHGVLSLRGHMPGPPGVLANPALSVAGPLARSAGDLRLMMDVLLTVDPFTGIPGASLPEALPRSVADMRVGVWSDDVVAPVAKGVKDTVEALAAKLAGLGATVSDAHPDRSSQDLHETYMHLLMSVMGVRFPQEIFDGLDGLARSDEDSADAKNARWITSSHKDWVIAAEDQAQAIASWDRLFESVDFVIAPVAPSVAFPHNTDVGYGQRVTDIDGVDRTYGELLFWAGIATMPHLPSVIIPAGSSDGMPCGVQLIAKRWSDLQLLSDAAAVCAEVDITFEPVAFDPAVFGPAAADSGNTGSGNTDSAKTV